MEFCPVCGTMLQFERPDMNHPSRFACPLCPYVCNMQHNVKIKRKEALNKKEIQRISNEDDKNEDPQAEGKRKDNQPIFIQDAMMEGPQTEVTCPSCNHGKAVYHQLQTRSADEPMTIFYMCANKNCKHRWKEE